MEDKKPLLPALRSAFKGAFTWSRDEPVSVAWCIGAALGMGVPLAIGAWAGRADIGMIAALGGLALGGTAYGGTLRGQGMHLVYALVAGTLAVLAGSAASGHGWAGGAAIVLVTLAAALIGGMGRTVAQNGSRFIIFMVIASGFSIAGIHDIFGVTFVFLVGAAWTLVAILLSLYLFRLTTKAPATDRDVTGHRQPLLHSLKKRLHRWTASLHYMAGWQYALRIGLCMAACETIIVLWGQAQAYWIAIVVAIVIQRTREKTMSRLVQRGIGTFFGVLAGSLFLLWVPPAGILILAVVVLAALRQFLSVRNYALYSAAMTPLVLILISFGQPVSPAIIAYRLVDTVIGLVIAFVLGYLIWPPVGSTTVVPVPIRGGDGPA